MSSPKRLYTSHDGTAAVDPPPPIPVDVLLEILARVDVATVVRCAATSKTVRRAILGNPTIGPRVEANANNNGDLLLGVSYAISEYDNYGNSNTRASFVGQAPRQDRLGFNACAMLRSSEPVASRGGLIVLRDRRRSPQWFIVWNSVARRILLWMNVAVDSGYPYPYALGLVTVGLLTVGDYDDAGRRSFQLLVVSYWPRPSLSLRTQIYSSKDDGSRWGDWGPVTEITHLPPEFPECAPSRRRRPEAVVLGGGTAVHWLHNNDSGRCIVRLDIDKAKAVLIAMPPECVHRPVDDGELQLAASTDGKLSLVVAEHSVISMWTLSGGGGSARWSRQVLISREAIAGVPTGGYKAHRDLFMGLGELSCTVVLLMHQVGLVRINLRTKEADVLGSDDDELKEIEAAHDGGLKKIEACLHEIDLSSILLAMKPY